MRTLILGLSLSFSFSAYADVFCSATCAVGPYRSAVDYTVYASAETHEEALNNMFNQCKAKRVHYEDPIVFFTSASERSSWDYSRKMEFDLRKACINQ